MTHPGGFAERLAEVLEGGATWAEAAPRRPWGPVRDLPTTGAPVKLGVAHASERTSARPPAPTRRERIPPPEPIEDELWIPAEARRLHDARVFVDSAAAAYGFDDASRQAIKLAMTEALANALVHGSPCLDGRIRVRIAGEDGELTCAIADCGHFVPGRARGELAEGGRGLDLIRALMDELDVSTADDGTVVRFTKRLPDERAAKPG